MRNGWWMIYGNLWEVVPWLVDLSMDLLFDDLTVMSPRNGTLDFKVIESLNHSVERWKKRFRYPILII